MKYGILILFTILVSCKEREEKVLDNKLYQKIIEYQRKFPIPKDNPKNRIFVYKIYFWKEDKDTLVVFQRSPAGISKNDLGYGIYEDDKLRPTYIYDDKHLGDKLILKKIKNKNDKFYWKDGARPESFPPTYTYSLKDNQLNFVKVDTVWKRWD